jgi:zinc/manganese transport system ATP-binding protein
LTNPVLFVDDASMRAGKRVLWEKISFTLDAGQVMAVIGTNGSGKTTLLKAILGLEPLSSGRIEIAGQAITRGNRRIGYIPQQKLYTEGTPMRGMDLVALGMGGDRYGIPWPDRQRRQDVAQLIEAVGATAFAHRPIGQLSGGEQQRLRVAQAIASEPSLLLCDEPLLSLDIRQQREISTLIAKRARDHEAGVLFVTHDINPVIDIVDSVLYLAGGKYHVGSVSEVMRSDVLSALYDTQVEVVQIDGKLFVVGTPDAHHGHPHIQAEVL